MQQPHEPKPDVEFRDRLSPLLQTSRLALLILLIVVAIAAFFVGYFVWTGVNRGRNEHSTLLAEQAQVKYDEWQGMPDGEPKTQAEDRPAGEPGPIIRQYPQQYATQRALFLRAHLAAQKKNWQGAAEDYQDLARRFPRLLPGRPQLCSMRGSSPKSRARRTRRSPPTSSSPNATPSPTWCRGPCSPWAGSMSRRGTSPRRRPPTTSWTMTTRPAIGQRRAETV